MIFLKILLNVWVLFVGIGFFFVAKRDLERKWYPKWVSIIEIIGGILLVVWSFSIWFFV